MTLDLLPRQKRSRVSTSSAAPGGQVRFESSIARIDLPPTAGSPGQAECPVRAPILGLSLSLQSHAERVLCQGEKHAMGFSLTRPDWSRFSGRCRNVRNLFLAVCSPNEATRRLAARLALVFQSAVSLLNPLAAVRLERHAVR